MTSSRGIVEFLPATNSLEVIFDKPIIHLAIGPNGYLYGMTADYTESILRINPDTGNSEVLFQVPDTGFGVRQIAVTRYGDVLVAAENISDGQETGAVLLWNKQANELSVSVSRYCQCRAAGVASLGELTLVSDETEGQLIVIDSASGSIVQNIFGINPGRISKAANMVVYGITPKTSWQRESIDSVQMFNLSEGTRTTIFSAFRRHIRINAVVEYRNSTITLPPTPEKDMGPARITIKSNGNATSAQLYGGLTSDNGETFASYFSAGETIQIPITIEPEPVDIGANSEIFVVALAGASSFLVTPAGLINWDGTIGSLVAFKEIALEAENTFNILDPFGGEFALTESEVGSYDFFIGYTVGGGVITYTSEPIELNVLGFEPETNLIGIWNLISVDGQAPVSGVYLTWKFTEDTVTATSDLNCTEVSNYSTSGNIMNTAITSLTGSQCGNTVGQMFTQEFKLEGNLLTLDITSEDTNSPASIFIFERQ